MPMTGFLLGFKKNTCYQRIKKNFETIWRNASALTLNPQKVLSENWQSLQEAQSRLVHVHWGLAQKEKLRFMTWLINWNALGLYKTGSTSIKTTKICQKCQQTDVWDWWTIKQNTHMICAKLGNQHYLMIPMTESFQLQSILSIVVLFTFICRSCLKADHMFAWAKMSITPKVSMWCPHFFTWLWSQTEQRLHTSGKTLSILCTNQHKINGLTYCGSVI